MTNKDKKYLLKQEPKEPKFTSHKGKKRTYLSYGWSRDGLKFFKGSLSAW